MSNLVLLDNGHGTPPLTGGKHSPDNRLSEPVYARDIVQRISRGLTLHGIDCRILVPEDTDIRISERVRRANAWCSRLGAKNVLLVSVHNNASGSDGKWHEAHGWQVYVSKNASEASKRCARLLTAGAEKLGLVNPKSRQKAGYWTWSWRPDDIGILKQTKCPAVLTENLFQDNLADVDYLLSEEGRNAIADLHVRAIIQYLAASAA